MKGRFSRSHKSRDSFKVDTMLAEKLREQSEEKDCVSPRGLLGLIHSKKGPANYFNIIILGIADGQLCKFFQEMANMPAFLLLFSTVKSTLLI